MSGQYIIGASPNSTHGYTAVYTVHHSVHTSLNYNPVLHTYHKVSLVSLLKQTR